MIAWRIQFAIRNVQSNYGALTFDDAFKIAVREYEAFIKDMGADATVYVAPSAPVVLYNLRRHGQAAVWEVAEEATDEDDGLVSSCWIALAPASAMVLPTGTPGA